MTDHASQRRRLWRQMPGGPSEPVASCLQVCSVLESLEQEYKREEDWCGGADKLGPNSETDHVTPMISKHLEQKEAFLKVRSGPWGAGASLHSEGARLSEPCVSPRARRAHRLHFPGGALCAECSLVLTGERLIWGDRDASTLK